MVWDRLGNVPNFVEPFFGSGAVLLGRPHAPTTETINDKDGFVCLAPETLLLGLDLRWVTAGTVSVGQSLVGFDEHNGPPHPGGGLRSPSRYRHYRASKVSAFGFHLTVWSAGRGA